MIDLHAICNEARQLAADDVLNDPDDSTLLLAILDGFPEVRFEDLSDEQVGTILGAYDAEVRNPVTPMLIDVRA